METTLEPSLNASQTNPTLTGLQILVVDNEVDTLELLKFVLEDYGAQVQTVTTAKDAIAALSVTPSRYDVLVSDIGMPDENGYFLIQQVRSLSAEAGGQIPAIALTAYASEAERQRAIESGFQRHVAKPVEPVQLGWTIANLAQEAL
ncbi:MAG: response regulator [Cyanobacteria bacterium CAN_BIN43]|nr:response regulator [Cyanobacteria bacterium CAN_BIN43]